MNLADALAGPGLLILMIAVPVSGVLAGLGPRGLRSALALLAALVIANLAIASGVSEYGDFGAMVILTVAFFGAIAVLIGRLVGGHLREQRTRLDRRRSAAGNPSAS